MTDFFDRLAGDWAWLSGNLSSHPLLWVAVLACFWVITERVAPLIHLLCLVIMYVASGFFALIVGWLERGHTR